MLFAEDNPINQFCARGMELEGQGLHEEAAAMFLRAWREATTDLEKCTAAHYVARHQKDASEKLQWDRLALEFAFRVDDMDVRSVYPSLYLNVARGLEDGGQLAEAKENYLLALSYSSCLPADGYGSMISSGIEAALHRLSSIHQ